uniref:Crp/Fnr family transcriptional regulator n=1 Tax=Candidatus Kentrum sp. SD TaxID=2126332 RepID=A0A451BK91_9GAMM|nr:MAG: hypothetical protein BECKSD772F_GA0070984_101413 [Candidatus Kentron sp. SD]VFK48881.1 MAG: hypothetical protein BECKSD772E_GA0070983_11475 [Candidatus Kentron sp. SD]VFK78711.1 MAG: hypothetical protein BECKSD772D_GA0070982_102232 [Candidatus Kentron sp. SD]
MRTQTKELIRLFSRLPDGEKRTLLAFAEFLVNRMDGEMAPEGESIPLPTPMPRPESETVIAAIRRLSKGYPMLDKPTMLNETSTLMAEHVLRGQPASEVIDKLEERFQRHYENMKSLEIDSLRKGGAQTPL